MPDATPEAEAGTEELPAALREPRGPPRKRQEDHDSTGELRRRAPDARRHRAEPRQYGNRRSG